MGEEIRGGSAERGWKDYARRYESIPGNLVCACANQLSRLSGFLPRPSERWRREFDRGVKSIGDCRPETLWSLHELAGSLIRVHSDLPRRLCFLSTTAGTY